MTDAGEPPILTGASKSNVQIIYILYLLFFFAGITALIGVVMAYVARSEAPDWLKSHYEFAIRTFWIWLFGVFMCAVLFMTILLIPISGLLGLFLTIWWVVRCVQGLDLVARQQPIPNPRSWLFASS